MSFIPPVPIDKIEDAELRDMIARCDELGVPGARFAQILAHKPGQARAALGAILHSHYQGGVDHKLKEVLRIQLARFAEDDYFASLRSKQAMAAGLTEEMIEAGCGDYEDRRCSPTPRNARCVLPSRCSSMPPRLMPRSMTR